VTKTSSDVWIAGCHGKEKPLLLENRELRIHGPKWDEMIRGWSKMHSEEFITCTLHQIEAERSSKGLDG
jgi:hypothetical protein